MWISDTSFNIKFVRKSTNYDEKSQQPLKTTKNCFEPWIIYPHNYFENVTAFSEILIAAVGTLPLARFRWHVAVGTFLLARCRWHVPVGTFLLVRCHWHVRWHVAVRTSALIQPPSEGLSPLFWYDRYHCYHRYHRYFDIMLDGERLESLWIRIPVLIRESVLSGKIVAVLGNPDYDAKQSAKTILHPELQLELEMWLTLYWQWSIHSGRRKRGRTSWLAIHVVEWKLLFWIEQEILCTWSEYDMKWIVEYHYLIWFLKIRKARCTFWIAIQDIMLIRRQTLKINKFLKFQIFAKYKTFCRARSVKCWSWFGYAEIYLQVQG